MFHNSVMRRGQVVVVVLLMLAVATTVGLAMVSRSVTEIGVTTTQEESARALTAAEAGVEAALSAVVASGTYTVGSMGTTYTVSSQAYGGGGEFTVSRSLTAAESETVFLSGHDTSGNLVPGQEKYTENNIVVCWGHNVTAVDATAPALEAILYFQTSGQVKVGRMGYDPNVSRQGQNSFQTAGSASGCPAGKTYAFSTVVALNTLGGYNSTSDNPLLLRLRLLYNGETGHFIGVKAQGSALLPAQGTNISSTGQSGSTNRKVSLFQRYGDPFPQFDNAVFSGAGLSK